MASDIHDGIQDQSKITLIIYNWANQAFVGLIRFDTCDHFLFSKVLQLKTKQQITTQF